MRTQLCNKYVYRLAMTWGIFLCGIGAGREVGTWVGLVAIILIWGTCFSLPERLEGRRA